MGIPKIAKEILKDMDQTRRQLWELGVISEFTGNSIKQTGNNDCIISWSTKNEANQLFYDMNLSIDYLFKELLLNRQFSILFYDKSILQAEYIIKDGTISKQRLLFMKRHNKIWEKEQIKKFEETQEITSEDWLYEYDGIPILFRMDFDSNPDVYKECDHAKAHFHLGNHEHCRIPLKGPVTFSDFISFIMFHFYNQKIHITEATYADETISEKEQRMMHLFWS